MRVICPCPSPSPPLRPPQGIVEQHVGGKIWCESAGEGHGCIFFVEMPVLDRSRLPPEMARWLGSVPSFSTLLGPTGPQRPPPTPLLHGAPGTHPPTPAAPAAPDASVVQATPLGRQPEPPSLRGASLSLRHPLPPRLHVLVVDDSDMNRKVRPFNPPVCQATPTSPSGTSHMPTSPPGTPHPPPHLTPRPFRWWRVC